MIGSVPPLGCPTFGIVTGRFSLKLAIGFFLLSSLLCHAQTQASPPGIPEPSGTLMGFSALAAKPAIPLRGILGLPASAKGKVPVVMLIWGSTCDNGTGWIPGSDTASGKDEAIFLDIRNAFIATGIAGFTYTKRGCSPKHGGTDDKSVRVTATRENLLADALAAFDVLKKRPEIDPNKIFVLGYSEGNTYAWEIGRMRPGEARGLLLIAMISGRYSIAEYYQQVLRRMEVFDMVDENHDGKITPDELKLYPCYADKDYFQLAKCGAKGDSTLERNKFRSCRERRFLQYMASVENTPAGKFIEDSNDPADWQRQLYASKSMIETVSDQETPVAIFQGKADKSTPEYEAIALHDALTSATKSPFVFKTYEGLSHGLAKGKGRNGHCEKFGPVDKQLLRDLIDAVKHRI